MIHIPTAKPTTSQLLTTLAGVAVSILGYYAPHLLPALLPLGKLLWAGGLFTAGAGAIQLPGKS